MRSFVATAQIEIIIYEAQSLKNKRQVLKSLVSRIRNQFNVSIAEIDYLNTWQRSKLGLACVANSPIQAGKQIDQILRYIERDPRLEVIEVDREIL